MSENNKFISGLAVGAVVGAALVLFLQSDKGKELLSSLKADVDALREQVADATNDAEESLEILMQKAKELVTDLEKKINKTPTV